MISVIIPAKNEVYLQKTIESVLSAARGEIEVIAVCDGYWPEPPVLDDKRVNILHYSESIGQRPAINNAAKIAKGKYLFKLDAHCHVDEGFDVKLAADCEYNWTVIPRHYVLDADTWEPKWHKVSDFLYFNSPWAIDSPFQMQYYDAKCARAFPKEYKAYKKAEWRKGDIADTMCSLGAAWFMHKDRFWELGGLDNGHAHWGQMAVEMACKAWLSGGRHVVNKKTWYAHQWRRKPPWTLPQRAIDKSRQYSVKFWTEGKWSLQKYPLEWLAEKFAPVPTWGKKESTPESKYKRCNSCKLMATELDENDNCVLCRQDTPLGGKKKDILNAFHLIYYQSWNKHKRTWMGVKHCKYPTDMMVHQQIIWDNKPEVIIECGSYLGGGTLFFANMLDCVGAGQVIGIDKRVFRRRKHSRIAYLTGPTTSKEILDQVKNMVEKKSCMVVLDSDHSRGHVKRELVHYSKIVTPGQFLVVEDTYLNGYPIKPEWGPGPLEAVKWFLPNHPEFKDAGLEYRNLLSQHAGGWLQKLR